MDKPVESLTTKNLLKDPMPSYGHSAVTTGPRSASLSHPIPLFIFTKVLTRSAAVYYPMESAFYSELQPPTEPVNVYTGFFPQAVLPHPRVNDPLMYKAVARLYGVTAPTVQFTLGRSLCSHVSIPSFFLLPIALFS